MLPLDPPTKNITNGRPSEELLRFILGSNALSVVTRIKASWLGGLATSGLGDRVLDDNGQPIRRSKSDILVEITSNDAKTQSGVSVKICNNVASTNAQLFFTTAVAFCGLLRNRGLEVSLDAEAALRMFCGDVGFRPRDDVATPASRKSDPDRWFWEELPRLKRNALEDLFSRHQRVITLVLLKYAYLADAYPPDFLIHQMWRAEDPTRADLAIYEIDDLVEQSMRYKGFELREYIIRKGRFKTDTLGHLAPRFGIVQFQRGGQKQHPTQLQFNLQASYFLKLATAAAGPIEPL